MEKICEIREQAMEHFMSSQTQTPQVTQNSLFSFLPFQFLQSSLCPENVELGRGLSHLEPLDNHPSADWVLPTSLSQSNLIKYICNIIALLFIIFAKACVGKDADPVSLA